MQRFWYGRTLRCLRLGSTAGYRASIQRVRVLSKVDQLFAGSNEHASSTGEGHLKEVALNPRRRVDHDSNSFRRGGSAWYQWSGGPGSSPGVACLARRLTELVMLANRLVNLPSAAHSLWKHNKISSPKADGLAPIRGHRHVPVQQQTGFTLVVRPGECADVAAPNRPVTQPKRQDRALGARRCDADHRDTSADVSDSLISGRLTIPNKQSTLPT